MAKKKIFQISDALTEGLEETINAVHNYSGEIRVDVIPIKRIEVDPTNPRDLKLTIEDVQAGISEKDPYYDRKCLELENLHTMANSIREQGIINPIVVYKFGDKYRLIAGERRTLASCLAGKLDIQAKILDAKPSALKISQLQWIENVERSDLSLWERLCNLEKIVTAYTEKKAVPVEQISITELSQLIGCTKPHAMNYKAVLFADISTKQWIQQNKLRNLEKAALIANLESDETREHILTHCLAGASLKKLRFMVEHDNRQRLEKKHREMSKNRGRQVSTIHFGKTNNIKIAQQIIEAVVHHFPQLKLHAKLSQVDNVDWTNYEAVNDQFKGLIHALELMQS